MERHRMIALTVSLVVLALAGASAQSTAGHIRGVVTDSAGLALPGAEVRLSRTGHNDRTTITNDRGQFSFLGLEPDWYQVSATLAGFRPASAWATITANTTIELSLTLEIAGLAPTSIHSTKHGRSSSSRPAARWSPWRRT